MPEVRVRIALLANSFVLVAVPQVDALQIELLAALFSVIVSQISLENTKKRMRISNYRTHYQIHFKFDSLMVLIKKKFKKSSLKIQKKRNSKTQQ